MVRASRWQIVLCSALALIAPPVTVGAMSIFLFPDPVVPDLLKTLKASDASISILSDISKLLISMAVGTGLAATWFFRQAVRARFAGPIQACFILSMFAALISIYAGLRFMFDMAMQLQQTALDFDFIQNRLLVQALALMAELSFLCQISVLFHFGRDRRFSKDND